MQIDIIFDGPNIKPITIPIQPNQTLYQLKGRICQELYLPPHEYQLELKFNERKLYNDSLALSSYGINANGFSLTCSVINKKDAAYNRQGYVSYSPVNPNSSTKTQNQTFQIFIKTLTGETITLNVEANDTISQLKQKIFERKDIPINEQIFVYAGKQLADNTAITKDMCRINLVVRKNLDKENEEIQKIRNEKEKIFKALNLSEPIKKDYIDNNASLAKENDLLFKLLCFFVVKIKDLDQEIANTSSCSTMMSTKSNLDLFLLFHQANIAPQEEVKKIDQYIFYFKLLQSEISFNKLKKFKFQNETRSERPRNNSYLHGCLSDCIREASELEGRVKNLMLELGGYEGSLEAKEIEASKSNLQMNTASSAFTTEYVNEHAHLYFKYFETVDRVLTKLLHEYPQRVAAEDKKRLDSVELYRLRLSAFENREKEIDKLLNSAHPLIPAEIKPYEPKSHWGYIQKKEYYDKHIQSLNQQITTVENRLKEKRKLLKPLLQRYKMFSNLYDLFPQKDDDSSQKIKSSLRLAEGLYNYYFSDNAISDLKNAYKSGLMNEQLDLKFSRIVEIDVLEKSFREDYKNYLIDANIGVKKLPSGALDLSQLAVNLEYMEKCATIAIGETKENADFYLLGDGEISEESVKDKIDRIRQLTIFCKNNKEEISGWDKKQKLSSNLLSQLLQKITYAKTEMQEALKVIAILKISDDQWNGAIKIQLQSWVKEIDQLGQNASLQNIQDTKDRITQIHDAANGIRVQLKESVEKKDLSEFTDKINQKIASIYSPTIKKVKADDIREALKKIEAKCQTNLNQNFMRAVVADKQSPCLKLGKNISGLTFNQVVEIAESLDEAQKLIDAIAEEIEKKQREGDDLLKGQLEKIKKDCETAQEAFNAAVKDLREQVPHVSEKFTIKFTEVDEKSSSIKNIIKLYDYKINNMVSAEDTIKQLISEYLKYSPYKDLNPNKKTIESFDDLVSVINEGVALIAHNSELTRLSSLVIKYNNFLGRLEKIAGKPKKYQTAFLDWPIYHVLTELLAELNLKAALIPKQQGELIYVEKSPTPYASILIKPLFFNPEVEDPQNYHKLIQFAKDIDELSEVGFQDEIKRMEALMEQQEQEALKKQAPLREIINKINESVSWFQFAGLQTSFPEFEHARKDLIHALRPMLRKGGAIVYYSIEYDENTPFDISSEEIPRCLTLAKRCEEEVEKIKQKIQKQREEHISPVLPRYAIALKNLKDKIASVKKTLGVSPDFLDSLDLLKEVDQSKYYTNENLKNAYTEKTKAIEDYITQYLDDGFLTLAEGLNRFLPVLDGKTFTQRLLAVKDVKDLGLIYSDIFKVFGDLYDQLILGYQKKQDNYYDGLESSIKKLMFGEKQVQKFNPNYKNILLEQLNDIRKKIAGNKNFFLTMVGENTRSQSKMNEVFKKQIPLIDIERFKTAQSELTSIPDITEAQIKKEIKNIESLKAQAEQDVLLQQKPLRDRLHQINAVMKKLTDLDVGIISQELLKKLTDQAKEMRSALGLPEIISLFWYGTLSIGFTDNQVFKIKSPNTVIQFPLLDAYQPLLDQVNIAIQNKKQEYFKEPKKKHDDALKLIQTQIENIQKISERFKDFNIDKAYFDKVEEERLSKDKLKKFYSKASKKLTNLAAELSNKASNYSELIRYAPDNEKDPVKTPDQFSAIIELKNKALLAEKNTLLKQLINLHKDYHSDREKLQNKLGEIRANHSMQLASPLIKKYDDEIDKLKKLHDSLLSGTQKYETVATPEGASDYEVDSEAWEWTLEPAKLTEIKDYIAADKAIGNNALPDEIKRLNTEVKSAQLKKQREEEDKRQQIIKAKEEERLKELEEKENKKIENEKKQEADAKKIYDDNLAALEASVVATQKMFKQFESSAVNNAKRAELPKNRLEKIKLYRENAQKFVEEKTKIDNDVSHYQALVTENPVDVQTDEVNDLASLKNKVQETKEKIAQTIKAKTQKEKEDKLLSLQSKYTDLKNTHNQLVQEINADSKTKSAVNLNLPQQNDLLFSDDVDIDQKMVEAEKAIVDVSNKTSALQTQQSQLHQIQEARKSLQATAKEKHIVASDEETSDLNAVISHENNRVSQLNELIAARKAYDEIKNQFKDACKTDEKSSLDYSDLEKSSLADSAKAYKGDIQEKTQALKNEKNRLEQLASQINEQKNNYSQSLSDEKTVFESVESVQSDIQKPPVPKLQVKSIEEFNAQIADKAEKIKQEKERQKLLQKAKEDQAKKEEEARLKKERQDNELARAETLYQKAEEAYKNAIPEVRKIAGLKKFKGEQSLLDDKSKRVIALMKLENSADEKHDAQIQIINDCSAKLNTAIKEVKDQSSQFASYQAIEKIVLPDMVNIVDEAEVKIESLKQKNSQKQTDLLTELNNLQKNFELIQSAYKTQQTHLEKRASELQKLNSPDLHSKTLNELKLEDPKAALTQLKLHVDEVLGELNQYQNLIKALDQKNPLTWNSKSLTQILTLKKHIQDKHQSEKGIKEASEKILENTRKYISTYHKIDEQEKAKRKAEEARQKALDQYRGYIQQKAQEIHNYGQSLNKLKALAPAGVFAEDEKLLSDAEKELKTQQEILISHDEKTLTQENMQSHQVVLNQKIEAIKSKVAKWNEISKAQEALKTAKENYKNIIGEEVQKTFQVDVKSAHDYLKDLQNQKTKIDASVDAVLTQKQTSLNNERTELQQKIKSYLLILETQKTHLKSLKDKIAALNTLNKSVSDQLDIVNKKQAALVVLGTELNGISKNLEKPITKKEIKNQYQGKKKPEGFSQVSQHKVPFEKLPTEIDALIKTADTVLSTFKEEKKAYIKALSKLLGAHQKSTADKHSDKSDKEKQPKKAFANPEEERKHNLKRARKIFKNAFLVEFTQDEKQQLADIRKILKIEEAHVPDALTSEVIARAIQKLANDPQMLALPIIEQQLLQYRKIVKAAKSRAKYQPKIEGIYQQLLSEDNLNFTLTDELKELRRKLYLPGDNKLTPESVKEGTEKAAAEKMPVEMAKNLVAKYGELREVTVRAQRAPELINESLQRQLKTLLFHAHQHSLDSSEYQQYIDEAQKINEVLEIKSGFLVSLARALPEYFFYDFIQNNLPLKERKKLKQDEFLRQSKLLEGKVESTVLYFETMNLIDNTYLTISDKKEIYLNRDVKKDLKNKLQIEFDTLLNKSFGDISNGGTSVESAVDAMKKIKTKYEDRINEELQHSRKIINAKAAKADKIRADERNDIARKEQERAEREAAEKKAQEKHQQKLAKNDKKIKLKAYPKLVKRTEKMLKKSLKLLDRLNRHYVQDKEEKISQLQDNILKTHAILTSLKNADNNHKIIENAENLEVSFEARNKGTKNGYAAFNNYTTQEIELLKLMLDKSLIDVRVELSLEKDYQSVMLSKDDIKAIGQSIKNVMSHPEALNKIAHKANLSVEEITTISPTLVDKLNDKNHGLGIQVLDFGGYKANLLFIDKTKTSVARNRSAIHSEKTVNVSGLLQHGESRNKIIKEKISQQKEIRKQHQARVEHFRKH